jgi:hypothetical protein
VLSQKRRVTCDSPKPHEHITSGAVNNPLATGAQTREMKSMIGGRFSCAGSVVLWLLSSWVPHSVEGFSVSQSRFPAIFSVSLYSGLSNSNDLDSVTRGIDYTSMVDTSLRRRSFLVQAAAVATWSSAFSLPARAISSPPTGTKAPNFELPNSRGEGLTSLKKLTATGKWTVCT